MIRIKALFVSSLFLALAAGTASAQYSPDYVLIWADEFNGTALDPTKWEPQIGDGTEFGIPGWGNNELQYYTERPENITVANGLLTITGRSENFGGKNFTSARLRTINRLDFTYGRVAARIQVPKGDGMWPAFWMLPTNSPYGGWAAGGEIDIMENKNEMLDHAGTIHYGGAWPRNTFTGRELQGEDYSSRFFEYAVEWNPDTITWFVDGQFFFQLDRGAWFSENGGGNPRAPFDTDFHLLVNLAIGGNYPGRAPAGNFRSAQMLVDWVRVYRLEQQPFNGEPALANGRIEAEDFDIGYTGEAYNDATRGNSGGQYRDTDVDIEISSQGGFNVGFLNEGDWMEYTVLVPATGFYSLTASVASRDTGGFFSLTSDRGQTSGIISAPVTGDWQNWTTVNSQIFLEGGVQTLRLDRLGSAANEMNIDYFSLNLFPQQCPKDRNGDGSQNFLDIIEFLKEHDAGTASADMNVDGVFNSEDIQLFLLDLGEGCSFE